MSLVQKDCVNLYVVFMLLFLFQLKYLQMVFQNFYQNYKRFSEQWGIHHSVSSAYHPMSNGRAELAVKATKRLLMENVDLNGELNKHRVVQVLLKQRNTPDPGCKLSYAHILLVRKLKNSLPYVRKNFMIYNNPQISKRWRD